MIIFSQCNKCQREIDPEIIKLWQSNAPQLPSKGGTSLRENMDQEIATMIPDSEEIINFSHCSIRGSKAKDVNFVGTVVVTDKNVYLVKRKFKVFGKPEPLTKESMALNQITGIDQTFEKYLTIKSFHIRITRANNEDILYGLTEASASQIMKSINDQMHKSSSSNSSVTVNPIDPVEQLTKLAALLEKGLLTDEEFQKKKRELLGL
jgi:ribosomal protein L6P/L9E